MKNGRVGVIVWMVGSSMWLAGCAHKSSQPFEAAVKRQEQQPLVAEPAAPEVVQAAKATTQPVVAAAEPLPQPPVAEAPAPETVPAPATAPAPETAEAGAQGVSGEAASQAVVGLTVMPTTAPSTVARLPGGMTVPAPGPSVMQMGPVVTPVGHIPTLMIDSVIRRDWPVSVAYRPSGDEAAGPTWWSQYKYGQRREIVAAILEPFEFVLDTALIPVRMIKRPPGTVVVYSPVGPPGDVHVDFGQPDMGPPISEMKPLPPAPPEEPGEPVEK